VLYEYLLPNSALVSKILLIGGVHKCWGPCVAEKERHLLVDIITESGPEKEPFEP
jgi:hypothetical protein